MSDEGYGAVSGLCDVHHGGPGTPPLAVSGWHEGGRQGTVPECPRVPDRPVRRRGGELRPAVLRCTEADWGNPAHPAPACSCCLHPPPLPRSRRSSLQPSSAVEPAAGQPPRPSRPPPNQAASVEASGPETDDPGMEMFALREMVNAPLPPPEEGRAENLLFPFLPLASRSVVPKTSAKEQFPLSLGPQRGRGVVNESNLSYTHPPLSPVGSCGRFERAVNRTTHAPSARTQVSASHTPTPLRTGNETPEPGPCIPPRCPTAGQRDARAGSLRSPSLPHRGYVSGFVGVTSTVLGGLASAPQPVSLAPPYHQTRLCDSVRPATSQVSRHPLHHSEGSGCPHLASRDRSPTGEGRDRAGPSSRYEVGVLQPLLHCTQEKRWVKTNLGSARFEPGPSQAPVQNAHTETHLCVRPSPRLVCSNRPEGRVLPCVDPSAPQAIPAVCVRRTGISVQSPALRAVPVAPCLHESSGGSPCSPERTGRAHSQLPRRLAYTSSVAGPVMRTQGHGALAPQPVGPSGQLGKEQTLPGAEDLFSRYGVRLGQSDSAPHAGTRSVGVELLEYIQEQDGGTTETVSEAPGAYGGCGGSHAAGAAPYETASTLAPWPSPEVGVAERHAEGPSQTFTPWSDLSFLRAGVPLEQVSRHAVVYTDASAKGWGATFNGHAVSGVWTGPQLHWHINCLELLAVHLALNRLKGRLRGEHVLVRTDNTATVAYINRQGGLRSRRMSQLARHLLLWSRKHLRSLRAIHIPGLLNRTADELSRAALPGEWRLHPQTVQLIWRRFGLAQVDLFASLETLHCQLFYSLTDGTLGTDALAHSWLRGLRKYAFPPVSLLAQTLCKVREEEEQILLVAPYWPTRTWFPELMLLVTAPPWQIPLRKDLLTQRRGTLWHPRPDLWKLHVWSLDGTRRF